MSQRIAGCCCGKCVNAALGVCCIKLPASTANCLGDCEGFDPNDGTSVGIISNYTTAQCTQAGIDYGLNVVFTVYPNCAPISICDCLDSVTECVCANQNGIWNGSNNCATACLGSCCVRDLNGQRISCHDLMTECDCDALKSPTQNTLWTVGLNCLNSPCQVPCGPDLCLGGNNGRENILVRTVFTRTINFTFNGLGGCYQKLVSDEKYIRLDTMNRDGYDLMLRISRFRNGPIISVVNEVEEQGTTVENETYGIVMTSNCIDYGCMPNSSYSNSSYEGHGEFGPSHNAYKGTLYITYGDLYYVIRNSCLLPYQISLLDWWTDATGSPTCPVSAECQAKLNAYRAWVPPCPYGSSTRIETGTSSNGGCA